MVQILHLDDCPIRLRHVRLGVALFASHRSVLPLQRVAGLAMVELGARFAPSDNVEIGPGVFLMAARAIFFVGAAVDHRRVITFVLRDPVANFVVAIQTPQLRRTGAESVAEPATGRTGERRVGFRERPRRDLGGQGNAQQSDKCEQGRARHPGAVDPGPSISGQGPPSS